MINPSSVHVLAVEDDDFTREATVEILRSCGYHVVAVEDGRQALRTLMQSHSQFDLVLCDVMLPLLSGIDLLTAIQKHPSRFDDIPVVMTSSNEEMNVVASCLSKGAKDYLIKPVQVNTAKTLFRHVWLRRQKQERSRKKVVLEKEKVNNQKSSVWQDLDIIRVIGKGTHGNVLLARRKVDGAIVAVKKVQMLDSNESGQRQAENEVLLLKSLYHVNVVRLYDHFTVDGELNIVMEYSDGGNLRQLIKERAQQKMGAFPVTVIMNWFAQLVLAVAYIHGKNVVHRDLKAQNVFLTRKNVVKLGDFGISKALSGDVTANTACGTPESMSPEICKGVAYGKKSDIWSLGCILYEMITLRRPFEARTLPGIFSKICQGDFEPVPPSFSSELRLLVQLMLQLDPEKRPSIEDISRFAFVQAPIQAFLNAHQSEFQEALELEAKICQPSFPRAKNAISAFKHVKLERILKLEKKRSNQEGSTPKTKALDDEVPQVENKAKILPAYLKSFSSELADRRAKRGDLSGLCASIASTKGCDEQKDNNATGYTASYDPISLAQVLRRKRDLLTRTDEVIEDKQDELDMVDEIRSIVVPHDIRSNLFQTYTACVYGSELLEAIINIYDMTQADAHQVIALLVHNKQLVVLAADDSEQPDFSNMSTFIRFQMDEIEIPLNMKYIHTGPDNLNPMQVSLSVRYSIAAIHAHNLYPAGIHTGFKSSHTTSKFANSIVKLSQAGANDTREASYRGERFNADIAKEYRYFLHQIAQLQKVDLRQLSKHDRQPFFINIYNTMVLHGLVEFGVPQNNTQYRKFKKSVQYCIGSMLFSLADIRHGIIRCNRKPPNRYWERQLQPDDPRLQYKLHINDPRSLLALIEASDPVICASEALILHFGRVDMELEDYLQKYCSKYLETRSDDKCLVLAKIFRTYRVDFAETEGLLIQWLSQYMVSPPNDLATYRVRYTGGIAY